MWGKLANKAAFLHESGLWSGPAYSWPVKAAVPSLFSKDSRQQVTFARRDALRKKQGRVVCTHRSVGIFGYRACYYVPFPWWKRQANLLGWWLDQHQGALSLGRLVRTLVGKWYARKVFKRLQKFQKERAGKPTNSHFLVKENERGKPQKKARQKAR